MTSKRHILPLLIVTAIALALFYPVLDGTRLLTERDLSLFFIPPRFLWVKEVKDGVFPLWNPYSYSGQPLFALLQPGVLYPVNVLLLILPFDLAFNWTVIIHFILAGAFTYLLVTEMKAGRASSLISAITFMLSGYIFSVHNVISTLFTTAWVPLALLLYMRAIKGGSIPYAVASGIVSSVMFMGGGIEVLFGTLVLLLILSLAPAILYISGEEDRAPLHKRLILFAVSIVVFLGISSVQLLPFLELAGLSIRAGGLPYHEATTWSLDLKDFIQFFIPDPYGYFLSDEKYWANQSWLKTVYLGALPFMLSAFFLAEGGKRLLPFVLTALFYLSLAMGRNNLFYPLLYGYAPFFDKIRYPVKFLFLPFLFISVSAGLGYESLKRGLSGRKKWIERSLLIILILSTFAALALGFLNFFEVQVKGFLAGRSIDYPEYNHAGVNIFNAKRLLVFFILVSTAVYAALRSLNARRALPYIIITVLTFDLFFAHSSYYGTTPGGVYHRKGWALEQVSKDGDELYRVFVTPKTMETPAEAPRDALRDGAPIDMDKERIAGYNLLHGVFDISGIEVMRTGDYDSLYKIMATRPGPDSTNILAMLNVRYVVSVPAIKSREFTLRAVLGAGAGTDEPGMKALKKKNTLKVYENRNYLPRFFLVNGYTVVKGGEEYVDILSSKAFNPGSTVILEKPPWKEGERGGGGGGGKRGSTGRKKTIEKSSVQVMDYGYSKIRLKVRSAREAILVASESYYPGWKAYVDGVEREVLRADYVLRAVSIDPGEHEVVFSYEPASFRTGSYISAFTALGLILYGLRKIRRPGRKRG